MADLTRLYLSIARRFAKYAFTAYTGLDGSVADTIDDVAEQIFKKFRPELTYLESHRLALQYEAVADAFYSNLERFHRDRSTRDRFVTTFLSARRKSARDLTPTEERELEFYVAAEFESALLAVQESLGTANITVADMTAARFNAAEIEQRLVNSRRELVRDLSEPARELYAATIRDCVQLLVGLCAQKPEFTIVVARAVLSGQDAIAAKIDAIGSDLRALIVNEATEASANNAGFTTRVKMSISQSLRRIEQFGVPGDAAFGRYDLPTAFVELDAQVIDTSARKGGRSEIGLALATGKRFFIRGEAGTGKTTVLQWIAHMSAASAMREELAFYNDKIPVFIKLRSIDIHDLKASSILDYVAPQLTSHQPPGWIKECLDQERFIFLLDGVDEVDSKDRGDVRTWLEAMIVDFPNQTFFVTSRPAAVPARWLDELSFTVMNVHPMSEPKIKIFVERWHDAVKKSSFLAISPADVDACRQKVLASVGGKKEVRALAAFPLLAAMLCSMSLGLRGQLPRSRMEFYRASVEALVSKRDNAAQVPANNSLSLDLAQRRTLMQHLAYWMTQNGRSDADAVAATGCLGRTLANLPGVDAAAEDVYDFLLERSGLLREPEQNTLEFVHKSFQEYLAGAEYQANDLVDYLANNAHADHFRDIFIFAVGHSEGVRRERILGALVTRFASASGKMKRDIGMALAAALEVCESLMAATQHQILDAVKELAPPSDMFEAVHFSHALAADPTLLDSVPIDGAEAASSSVMALCMTARPEVPLLVERFCKDSDPQVVGALLSGAEYFPPSDYATKVFPLVRFIGDITVSEGQIRFKGEAGLDVSIHLPTMNTLGVFGSMEGLRCLSVTDSGHLNDISALLGCANLRELRLSHCSQVRDVSSVISHPALEVLAIGDGVSLEVSPFTVARPDHLPPLHVYIAKGAKIPDVNSHGNIVVHMSNACA